MTTRQEIIKRARARLNDGSGRAYSEEHEECRYRTTEGSPCVVGSLLADDEYTPKMESLDVPDLKARGLLPQRLVPHLDLLTKLQRLHDSKFNWDGARFVGWGNFNKIANEEI